MVKRRQRSSSAQTYAMSPVAAPTHVSISVWCSFAHLQTLAWAVYLNLTLETLSEAATWPVPRTLAEA